MSKSQIDTRVFGVLPESAQQAEKSRRKNTAVARYASKLPDNYSQAPPTVSNQLLPVALREPQKNAQLLQTMHLQTQQASNPPTSAAANSGCATGEAFCSAQLQVDEETRQQYLQQQQALRKQSSYRQQQQLPPQSPFVALPEGHLATVRVVNKTNDWHATGETPLPPPLICMSPVAALLQQQQQQQSVHEASMSSPSQRTSSSMSIASSVGLPPALVFSADELANEEAYLAPQTLIRRRPVSPYTGPRKVDFLGEHCAQLNQRLIAPERCAQQVAKKLSAADLSHSEAKLWREIQDIDDKQFNPQQLVLPTSQSHARSDASNSAYSTLNSTKTNNSDETYSTMQRILKRKPNSNKSQLPFAFDNFSTKGIRGNIATVGAVLPERPFPPVYPMVVQ